MHQNVQQSLHSKLIITVKHDLNNENDLKTPILLSFNKIRWNDPANKMKGFTLPKIELSYIVFVKNVHFRFST